MSDRMPFGSNTLVIPFKFVRTGTRVHNSGGMSRMADARALFRYGIAPHSGRLSSPADTERDQDQAGTLMLTGRSKGSVAPIPRLRPATSERNRTANGGMIFSAATRDRLGPDPNAEGPHTSFRTNQDTGRIENYETYEMNPSTGGHDPIMRYRGSGKPHGKVDTPLVLERPPGKGPGATPSVARPATPAEIPGGRLGGGGARLPDLFDLNQLPIRRPRKF